MSDLASEFSVYVAARQHALVRTAFLLTGDHHAAQDLVQSALARTYVAWGRIRDKGAADAYVRRTMLNEYHSWWRRAWRHRERSTATLPEHPSEPTDDPAERDEVWELLLTLPPRQRAAIVLRYYEDLTEAQTAHALGCSVGTVKSQTSRGLATLRARLGERDGQPSTAYLPAEGEAR